MDIFKLFLIISLSQSVFAESLDRYLEKAVESSYITQRNKFLSQELSLEKKINSFWENPTIGFEYGRVKNTGITGSLIGASFEQSIPIDGHLRIESDKTQEDIKQANISGQWQINEFKAQILRSFLSLWLEREKISHAKHRAKDLGVLRQYLTNRKFSSPQQKSDAYLIKKKIDEIEYQLDESSFKEKKLKKALSSLIGEDVQGFSLKLRLKDKVLSFFSSFISESQMIDEYRKSQKLKSELSLLQQKRQWIPDVNLGYAYQKENVPGGNLGHSVGIRLSIPMFDLGRTRSDKVKAQMRVQQARWKLQDLKRTSEIESLKEKLSYYMSLLSGSLENKEALHLKELKKIKEYFMKGLINAQTYLDVEEVSHELHYRQVSARVEVVNVFNDASLITGKEFNLKEVLQ